MPKIQLDRALMSACIEYFRNALSDSTAKQVSFAEVDKFLASYTGESSNFATLSLDYPFPTPDNLNPVEKALFEQNALIAFKVFLCGRSAVDEAARRYKAASLHNGNGDAFRHSFWNALMVDSVGVTWAEKWATAHETGASGQPQNEKTMDLHNNSVGRTLAADANAVQGAIRGGAGLQIVSGVLRSTDSNDENSSVNPNPLVTFASRISAFNTNGQCFFTCNEHPAYPLGKPFGPFNSPEETDDEMAYHGRETGHTDMVRFCEPNLSEVRPSGLNLAAVARGKECEECDTEILSLTSTCFCVGDCVKDSGDGSHFRKTIDVPCDLPLEEKKKRLIRDMMSHYLDKHVTNTSDPEAILRDMQQNIIIRCYSVDSSRSADNEVILHSS
jgi:hypothetical protein